MLPANSKILFPLFFLSCLISLSAQHKQFVFERITTEEGLTQNNINFITQDDYGYTWIATEDGLNRYDGYEVKTYRYDPSNKNSPRGNWMHRLYTDSRGNIYISQAIGGFDIFNQATGDFYPLVNTPSDSTTISSNSLPSSFLEDTHGNIWIGYAGGGLNKYNPEMKTIQRYLPKSFDENSISGLNISSIYQDKINDSSHVWVSTIDRGLNRININANTIERFEWRDIQYPQTLFEFIQNTISARGVTRKIIEVNDSADVKEELIITNAKSFIVICTGEALQQQKYDYGFITRDGKLIWDFDQRKSLNAGGANKNRILIDVIKLQPGRYELNYVSDDTHSFDRWNETPPSHREFWGIQLVEVSDEEAARIKRVIEDINSSYAFPSQIVVGISSDSKGNVYFSTWGSGLLRYDIHLNKFEIILKNKDENHNDNFLRQIGIVNDNLLWAFNKKHELLLIDLKEEKKIQLPQTIVVNPRVNNVSVDKYENIWVAQGSNGLYKISLEGNKVTVKHFTHVEDDEKSISSNAIRGIFSDKFGNVWIGTLKNGLNRINPGKINFSIALNNLPLNSAGDYPSISSFAEDNNNLYIGTMGSGIFVQDKNSQIISSIKKLNNIKFIRSLMIDGNFIWIGTHGEGFFIADLRDMNLQVKLYENLREEVSNQRIIALFKDSHGYYWVGTGSNGLYKLDPITNSFKHYYPNVYDSSSLPSVAVWSIYEDKFNTLWIGTAVGGLSRYDYDSDNFVNYLNNESDPGSINNLSITCFTEDELGNFWVGTYSGGINKMDRQKGQFSFITTKEGLPNNRIDGLLVDSDGCIWVSTNYGLARYNPQTGQIKKYEKTNGLQSNEFLRGSFYKSKDGMMYFGGAKGFNLFDPQRLSGSSQKPKILFTEFRKFNKPIRFDKSLNQLEEIELSYYDNHFSFEFIALDYSNPDKSQYAYKLEGFDPDWINSGSRRFASYTNLNPGSYTFRVKAANSEGIWNNEGISIALVITPPFWMTWWFYPLLTLVIASTLWGLHIRRLSVKVNHTLTLERIRISERETVREEMARDFHDELGHKLTRITVFVRRLKKHLNGAAKNIIDDLNNVSETSSDLRIGAKDLIWTLKPDEDSLYDLTIRLKDFGDDLFDGTDIKFLENGISDNLKKYNLPMEWKRHLVLIFKEAMNNSLKYAGCMNVELKVNVVNGTLTMSLCDDGVGFDSADQSNGYGINNIRTRAKKINGDLKVISNVGEGTTIKFVAEIPNSINEKVI